MGFTNGVSASFAVQYRLEIAFLAMILAFALVLAVKRWWGELTLRAAHRASPSAPSTLFYSVPRSMLTLFPIWVLLGRVDEPTAEACWSVYVAVCAPMMLDRRGRPSSPAAGSA